MFFATRQKSIIPDISIYVNGKIIDKVREAMFLGVVIDTNLSWKPHIAHTANKISKSIGILRKSSFYLKSSTLLTLYYSMIYPYLQYCNMIWASTFPSNLNRIVILQKRAIRIVSKSGFLAHTTPIFKDTQILKFHDIKKLQLGKFMFSYQNGLLPTCFNNMFSRNSDIHGYNTRHKDLYHIDFARTKLRQLSIIQQGPLFFNSLKNDIKNSINIKLFLSKLKKNIFAEY